MKDHIPLPAPDYTEDVQGFVHDTQRHYYSEETMRVYAERLHAARVYSPAIMHAIGLLTILQSRIGPRRPENSEPEEQTLWDRIEATRIALTPLAPAGTPASKEAPAAQGDAEQRCQHCIDRNDGFYGSYAPPCPFHDEDGKPRAKALQGGAA